ncbi:MAG: nitroreductase family protein [Nanoarchaeota archaeon]|nr:nitroreductase family protein [Nanoarchaeota archaeon]
MQLKDAIKERKSVKRFDKKKPDWRKIIKAIDAARFAPAAGNQFVMRFILVSDGKIIKELSDASQQDFVGTAQYVVVAVSDDSGLVRNYEERGVRYCAQQAGAAIENFLLALTELKLATTWVGHFYDDQVRRALDIPEGLHIEAMFPIGIETKIKTAPQRKMKLEQVLYFDKWNNKKMVPVQKLSKAAI